MSRERILSVLRNNLPSTLSVEDKKELFRFDSETAKTALEEYIFDTTFSDPENAPVKRLVAVGVSPSDEEARELITLVEATLLTRLMNSAESHGSSYQWVSGLLKKSVAKQSFATTPIFLEALDKIDKTEDVNLAGGRRLQIIKANVPKHVAFFVVEYDSSGKPDKISYCDGNASFARDEGTNKAYGEVVFKVDSGKLGRKNIVEHLKAIDFTGVNTDGEGINRAIICEKLKVGLSPVVETNAGGDLKVIAKKIPTKPQDRGNCSFKTTTLLMRKIVEAIHPEMSFENYTSRGYIAFKEIFKAVAKQNVSLLLKFLQEDGGVHPYYETVRDLMQKAVFLQAVSKADFELLDRLMPWVLRSGIDISDIKTKEGYNAFNAAVSTSKEGRRISALRWCCNSGIKIGAKEASKVRKSLRKHLGLSVQQIDAMIKVEDRSAIVEEEFGIYSKIIFREPRNIQYVFHNLYNWVDTGELGLEAALKIFDAALEKREIVNAENFGKIWPEVFLYHEEIFKENTLNPIPELLLHFIDRFGVDLNDRVSGKVGKSGEVLMGLARAAKKTEFAEAISTRADLQQRGGVLRDEISKAMVAEEVRIYGEALFKTDLNFQTVFDNLYNWIDTGGLGLEAARKIFDAALGKIVNAENVGKIWPEVFLYHEEIFKENTLNPIPELLLHFIDRFGVDLNDRVSGKVGKSGEVLMHLARDAGKTEFAEAISRKTDLQQRGGVLRGEISKAMVAEEVKKYSEILFASVLNLQSVFNSLYTWVDKGELGLEAALKIFDAALEKREIVNEKSIGSVWSQVFQYHKSNFGSIKPVPELLLHFIDRFYINLHDPVSREVGKSGEILATLARAAEKTEFADIISEKFRRQETTSLTRPTGYNNPAIDENFVNDNVSAILKVDKTSSHSLQTTLLNINRFLSEGKINILEAKSIFTKILQRKGMIEDTSLTKQEKDRMAVLGSRAFVEPEIIAEEIKKFAVHVPEGQRGFFDSLLEDYAIESATRMLGKYESERVTTASSGSISEIPAIPKSSPPPVPPSGLPPRTQTASTPFAAAGGGGSGAELRTPFALRKAPPLPAGPRPETTTPSVQTPQSVVAGAGAGSGVGGGGSGAVLGSKTPVPPSGSPLKPAAGSVTDFPTRAGKAPGGGLRRVLVAEYVQFCVKKEGMTLGDFLGNLNLQLNSETLNKDEVTEIIDQVGSKIEIEFSEVKAFYEAKKSNPDFNHSLKEILEEKFLKVVALSSATVVPPVASAKPLPSGRVHVVGNPLAQAPISKERPQGK